ncbi:MAG: glycosyltransferase family 4 protein [Cyanobacteria bacterium J06600_6]
MKIAVIGVKGLPAGQGGIERACQELYPRLVKLGHSVDLYARPSYTKKRGFYRYEYQGVQVIGLPALPFRGLDALFCSAMGSFVSSLGNYDIIHFHALGPSLFSWLPRLVSSSKIVATCHGLDWQRAKWGKLSSSIIYLGEKAAVRYADNLVVVSEDLQKYFAQTYDRDSVYIPNGPGGFAPTSEKLAYLDSLNLRPQKYLLFLGRLVPEKRPELLIEAFQKLQPQGWKLVLTGSTSNTEKYGVELRRLAKNNPNIIFTGELGGKSLAEIIRGAGLFVLPSDLEGLPLVMLEAMHEEIPVLASDIPPHKQLVGEDKGFLFKAGNLDSAVEVMQNALEQPSVRMAMAKRAKQHIVSVYNWDKIATQNLKVYTQLVLGNSSESQQALEISPQEQDAA